MTIADGTDLASSSAETRESRVPADEAPTRGPLAAEAGIEVEVSDTQGHLAVDPAAVKGLVCRVLIGERIGAPAAISVALVDERTIHQVNRRHLGHDYPTDVISFLLSEPDDPVMAGELVVSAERAVMLARRAGIDPWAELALYVVHGLLHLVGYDDRTPHDIEAMRRREDEILAREGLMNTFPLIDLARGMDGERECARWTD
jgi:probable rRNA maturation factor